MSSSNPLLQKWEEIYGKKEKPKVIKSENAKVEYKLKPEFLEQLVELNLPTPITSNLTNPSVATSNTGITKASTLVSYDKHSGNDLFLQIAEKVKNGTAQVTMVSLQDDAYGIFSYGKRITFEVYNYEP